MKIRILVPFIILLVSVFVMGSICGPLSNTTVPNQTSGNTNTVMPTSGIGAVNNLQDVQKATIQIESVGTFVDPQEGVVMNAAGRGSGFIIDPTGIAVTNNHVVTGSALIKVWVNGESNPRNAQIIGVSECSDLAVIKIEGGNFSYLDWYNHSPTVGLEVYTAGFPLGEPQFSMTKGIISKINADGQTNWASLDHTLSHDATQNPGNSGGPLVTADGKVVGITYAGAKAVDQYFAIDAITAQPIVGQLRTGVDIDTIGINGTAFVTEDGSISGIWIYSVKSGSPADKAGMKGGDILLQMEGLVLATDGTMKDYCDILRTHKPTDTLSVKVYRYSTGEMLEGQINGRSIAVVSSNPPATSVNQSGTGQEPMPGLAGKWIDPDSAGGGTISTIEFQNGLYVVTSVINTGRGPNELTTSSWANGVLTWEYCPANMHCITQHTVSLDGDVLTVDWAWSDGGSSGTSELQREP